MATKILAHSINECAGAAAPQRIIFREIAVLGGSGGLEIVYANDEDRIFDGDIDAFIASKQDYPSGNGAAPPANPAPRDNPLDLNCREDCFIVFYLSGDTNWQFSPVGDGFTTKEDVGPKYCGLTLIRQGGERVPGGTPAGDGCRLLFFRAQCRDEAFRDGFNLHVELSTGGNLRLPIVIDPDIRNPGGSGA